MVFSVYMFSSKISGTYGRSSFSFLRRLHAVLRASHLVLVEKKPPVNAGDIRDTDLIPGSGGSPGRELGNTLWCSCLEKPMDRGPGGL